MKEYKSVICNSLHSTLEEINNCTDFGWELVQILESINSYIAIMERSKTND